MSHVDRMKIQIPAPRTVPNSADAIGSMAAASFRLMDAGASSVLAAIQAIRPRTVHADLVRAIDELSADRPETADVITSTLKRVGNY